MEYITVILQVILLVILIAGAVRDNKLIKRLKK